MSDTSKQVAGLSPQPFRGNPNLVAILPCTTDKWDRAMREAVSLDRLASESCHSRGRNNPDTTAHLCAMQRQQEREGYVLAEVSTNVYGFCVRDTLNDGLGVLHSARDGGSAESALAFAMRWHAEAPDKREVIIGFVWGDDRKAELDAAIAALSKAGG